MSYQEFRPRSFQTLPPVIKNLLIINVILFVAKILLEQKGIDLDKYLSLHWVTATDFKPFQFITYMFMHATRDIYGNIMLSHIGFNMFAVWMFGSALENVWGGRKFLFYYVITGLGAAVVQYVVFYFQIQSINAQITDFMSLPSFSASDNMNLIHQKREIIDSMIILGASGSLFGILIAYGMMFPNQVLYVMFVMPVKAKWAVIAYGAIELFMGFGNFSGDNVAHFAHLGGMLFGFIVILIWKKNRNFYY